MAKFTRERLEQVKSVMDDFDKIEHKGPNTDEVYWVCLKLGVSQREAEKLIDATMEEFNL